MPITILSVCPRCILCRNSSISSSQVALIIDVNHHNHHSVKTPPCHHGGDSAHSSSLKHQQTNEREKNHITTKEQARIIVNNIRLFFDPSLIPDTTKPPKNGSKPFKSIAAGDLKPGDALDTIALKGKFEEMASSGGVTIAQYRTDKEKVAEKRPSVLEKKKSSVQSQHGSKPTKSTAAGDLKPGDAISTKQYSSSVKGRLDSGFGKMDSKSLMSGGTLFVDHASGFIYVANQVTLGASDTITSKRRFEQMALSGGVKIAQYRANNGIFLSREFEAEIERTNQAISFSGVRAQHQNGIAERGIRTAVEQAHTMLIHAAMRCDYIRTLAFCIGSFRVFVEHHS